MPDRTMVIQKLKETMGPRNAKTHIIKNVPAYNIVRICDNLSTANTFRQTNGVF